MLKSLNIKGKVIKNPVILAPQAGITDAPFRKLVASFGGDEYSVSLTISEMVPSASQVFLKDKKKNEKVQRLYENYNNGKTLTSVQIFGNNPDLMAQSALINQDLGADFIDINMGCPMPKIIKNGCGSALMTTPKLAEAIVSAVVKTVTIPVSVKIRTGWDANSKNAVEFAKILENAGASFITVHGRTRSQLYSGTVDLDTIANVKKSVSIPVIGNGDVFTPDDAKRMLEYTGVDGVMVGRGIYGAPWFISDVIYFLRTGKMPPQKSVAERKKVLLEHLDVMLRYYGEKTGLLNARKHIAWYSKGLSESAEFRRLINTTNTLPEVYEYIEKYFK